MTLSHAQFRRFEQARAHDYVAEQLRRLIALRVVLPGRSLPPERELARLYGVGRATVQKAIGILEADGLVSTRRGRSGGTFVVEAVRDTAGAGRVLARLRENRTAIEETLAYRLELEPGIAAAAAKARDGDALAELTEACRLAEASHDDTEFMEHDTALHLAIARTTANRFFIAAAEQFRLVLNDAFVALPDSALWHERSAAEHERIRAAIESMDADAARRAMWIHADNTAQSVRALLAAL